MERLQRENEELRARASEAEAALHAIRSGDVEALVIETPAGPRIFSLASAEAALNQLQCAMLNCVTDAVIAAGSDGRVIYLNPAAEQLCEMTSAQALGQELRRIIGSPLLPEDLSLPPQAPRHGIGFRNTADGCRLEYEFSLSPLSPANGSPSGTVIVFRDITSRLAAQEALRASMDFTRRITDIAPSILYVYDLVERCHVWGNQELFVSLGYSRDQIKGFADHIIDFLIHPDDLAGFQNYLSHIRKLADGVTAEFEYRVRHADGSWRWLRSKDAVFLREPNGEPRQMIGAALDVTSRKEMQLALAESEQRYRLLFDLNPDGVFSVDPNGRILIANPACEKLSGYSQRELLGKNFLELCAPDRKAETFEHFQTQTRHHTPAYSEFETALVQKSGNRVEVLVSGEPHVVDRRVVAVHCTAKDITARVLAERQLRESVERLRLAAHTANFGIHDYDVAGDCCYWSPELYQIAGVAPGTRVSRQSFAAQIHPDDRVYIGQRITAALEPLGPGTFDEEFRIIRPCDGQTRWIHNRSQALFVGQDASRRAVRVTGVVIDITTRKELEQQREALACEAENERSRLRSVLDVTGVGLWMQDFKTDRFEWDSRTRELFFLPPGAQATPELYKSRIHPDDRECVRQTVETALREHTVAVTDYRVIDPATGRVRWVHSEGRALYDEDGAVLLFDGINYDITERREFQMELERLVSERTARLQELVNELEHFSYSITHDLRAPLRAMASFSDIALELSGAPDQVEEQRHMLGRVRQATMRMDELIRDALKYNEAIRKQLPLTPVDVAQLLRGMLDSYPELQEAAEHIHLIHPLPPVLANEAGLTQCFSNLLQNAINFAHPDRPLRIRISAELLKDLHTDSPDFRGEPKPFQPAGFTPVPPAAGCKSSSASHRVRIWVEDNGIGIPEVLLPRVFNMFMRGSSGKPGTGIGLALVRKVVDRMGGLVGVHSVPDQGARFWIELTCADPAQLPAR